jgi:hypothetical protein
MAIPYDPPRQARPKPPTDPLEIDLVFNVRPCGRCAFFWPENPSDQPYGPYSTYDFNTNYPDGKGPEKEAASFIWIKGTTRAPGFPDAEVMDGCRKAPIMTIGINPNMTAFGPGRTGASWCYPSFSSTGGTDSWAKYAYYYRYRSVYQEHFDLAFAEKFIQRSGAIKAAKAGVMKDFIRPSDSPAYEIRVLYEGETEPTSIHIPGKTGEPPYVVLFDRETTFAAEDVLAAQLSVTAGETADVYEQSISYYTRMLPVLAGFESHLTQKGHQGVRLRVGEDVGQLDMVACASPHWGSQWLGGTSQSVNLVINNCVHENAWAIKQLLHSQPAVLLLVGQSSWNMFRRLLGRLVKANPSIPAIPVDGPYTLLRQTVENDCRLEFATTIDGVHFALSTRIVITPHFSYDINFLSQFRMSQEAWKAFGQKFPAAAEFLQHDTRITFQDQPPAWVAAGIVRDTEDVLAELRTKFSAASAELKPSLYEPYAAITGVLDQLFDRGELAWTAGSEGKAGYLSRSPGSCRFCDNTHWKFPQGCPYGKPAEKPYPNGFLEKVAADMIKAASE